MDKKRLGFTVLAFAAVVTIWASVNFGLGSVETLSGALAHVGLLTLVFLGLYNLADRVALRLPFAQLIGLPPIIDGTWVGSAQTNWVDPRTHIRPGPIPMMLTIRQTLTKVHCTARTAESVSYSYCEQLKRQASGEYELRYDYANKPHLNLKKRSPDHDGTTSLNVKQKPKRLLVGSYITQRGTQGTLRFEHHSRELLDSLPEDAGIHPVGKTDDMLGENV